MFRMALNLVSFNFLKRNSFKGCTLNTNNNNEDDDEYSYYLIFRIHVEVFARYEMYQNVFRNIREFFFITHVGEVRTAEK